MQTIGPEDVEPRTVIIIGTSYIETYLAELTKLQFPGLNSKLKDRLFENDGALSQFGTLIDVAAALNVLTGRGRREAIKLARVRNRFAHRLHISDFEHPDVAGIIDEIESYRGFRFTGTEYEFDNKDMSRRDKVVYLIREFCFRLSRHLDGERSWTVGAEDLHVEPHPASTKIWPGKSRRPPEQLTNLSDQLPRSVP